MTRREQGRRVQGVPARRPVVRDHVGYHLAAFTPVRREVSGFAGEPRNLVDRTLSQVLAHDGTVRPRRATGNTRSVGCRYSRRPANLGVPADPLRPRITMKLALFGATGTTGTAVLDQALHAGHAVQVLARTPAKISRSEERLTVIAGNAKDLAAVRATVAGCDAVISALGGFADSDSIRIGTAAIASAMQETGLRRLVVVQG